MSDGLEGEDTERSHARARGRTVITVIARSIDDNLRKLLNSGPVDSRIVLAALANRGFTPKQVRRARERLNVAVTRSGNRSAMRSMWSLPDGAQTDGAIRAPARMTFPDDAENPVAEFTRAEAERIERRTASFTTRGMDAEASAALAQQLVVARDRVASREGSCAECQSLEGSTCRASAAGHTDGPRPFEILWVCQSVRRHPWD